MKPVLVCGDGVAAYCCVHLLRQAGVPVALQSPSRPRLPAIMLSEAALKLIAEVFGHKSLFEELPRIRRRTVLWGTDQAAVFAHAAVVVSEEMLLDRLRPLPVTEQSYGESGSNIFASRPLPSQTKEECFGTRIARACAVEVRTTGLPGCWIESAEDGWLFLIASVDGKGWLLSVGASADLALDRSRLVAKQIERAGEWGGEFPAFPRIVSPLCGRTADRVAWLACGTAAIAFDPLCGDGTAHAVREAILAAAAIRAVSAGEDAEKVLAHYQARLIAGFQRHLANCVEFYRTGGKGPWWTAELRAVERGLAWCAEEMSGFPAFRYRLNGYELEAVA